MTYRVRLYYEAMTHSISHLGFRAPVWVKEYPDTHIPTVQSYIFNYIPIPCLPLPCCMKRFSHWVIYIIVTLDNNRIIMAVEDTRKW